MFPDAREGGQTFLYRESISGALEKLSGELTPEPEGFPCFEAADELVWQLEGMGGSDKRSDSRSLLRKSSGRDSSRGTAHALYGTELENSATRLEQFAKCACSHFLSYGLALRERVRYEFSMADLGTLLHNSLDLFARKVREQGRKWVDLQDSDACPGRGLCGR